MKWANCKIVKHIKEIWGHHCTGVPDFDIGYCCEIHDYFYERDRGPEERKKADKILRKLIISHGKVKKQQIRYFLLG